MLAVYWELTAVQFIESSSLWLQKQTHHQAQHQDVQLLILIYRPHLSLIQIKHFLSNFCYRCSLNVTLSSYILCFIDVVQNLLKRFCLAVLLKRRLDSVAHFDCGQLRLLKARYHVRTFLLIERLLWKLFRRSNLGRRMNRFVSTRFIWVRFFEPCVARKNLVLWRLHCFHLISDFALLDLCLHVEFFLSLAIFLCQRRKTQAPKLKFETQFTERVLLWRRWCLRLDFF